MTPLLLAFAGLAPAHPSAADPSAAAPLPPGVYQSAQLPCPGPTTHPFQRLPRVCPVPACPCPDGADGCHPGAVALHPCWVQEFHQAAHFPVPRFTADGQPVHGDGLLIYEGMRLTTYPDGAYEVAFTATVPEMPVTVRLQLAFTRPFCGAPEYFLTLPPIRLEPRRDARPGDPEANTFQVAHRGYSSLFRTHYPPDIFRGLPSTPPGQPPYFIPLPKSAIGREWAVNRAGTARFGSPVAVDDAGR